MSAWFGRFVVIILIQKCISISNGWNALTWWFCKRWVLYPDKELDANLFKVLVHVYHSFKSDCFLVYVDVQVEDIVRAAKRACYRSVPLAASAWMFWKIFMSWLVLCRNKIFPIFRHKTAGRNCNQRMLILTHLLC